MAISLVGIGTFITGTTTPRTFTLPGGVAAGDLIIVMLGFGEDAPEPSVNSVASGYAERGTKLFLDYGPGAINQSVYWKLAGSSEASPAFGVTDAAGGYWGYAMVWRGVDQTDPFDLAAVSQGTSAAATTFTPPTVATQTANAYVISTIQTSDNNTIGLLSGSEQGFTLSSVSGTWGATTDGVDASFGMAYKAIVTPATVTVPTWEQTALGGDSWAYQTLGIREPQAAPDPQLVTPGLVALTATMLVPTVTVTANQYVTPGPVALTLTTYAPTVSTTAHQTVTPGTVALTLTGLVPSVTGGAGTTVTPGPVALTLTTFAPTVAASDHKTVTPGVVALTATLYAPAVTASDNKTVTPGPVAVTFTALVPTVTASDNIIVTPGVAAFNLSLYAPTVAVAGGNVTVTPDTVGLVLAAFAPTVTATASASGSIGTPGRRWLIPSRKFPRTRDEEDWDTIIAALLD